MTRSIPAPARWLIGTLILVAASSWPWLSKASTVAYAQAPVKVCTKKPVVGETMTYSMNSASAVDSNGLVHPITTAPTSLNFAGLTGPAGLFASAVSLAAGNYTTLNLVMGNIMTIRGVITCDADGAGPLPTRTYYTGGNPVMTVPDPFVANPADAAPVSTTITSGGGDMNFAMPVPFIVTAGGNTTLNITYNTTEGFSLWDISVITGIPDTYKIVPNDITIMAAMPAP